MWLPQNVFVDTAVLLLLRPNGIYVRSWSILHAIVRLSFDLSLLTVLTFFVFFFFNDPAPPEISTLPLPAPLPISIAASQPCRPSPSLRRSWIGSMRSPPLAQMDQKKVNQPWGYFMPPANPHLTLPSFWRRWQEIGRAHV